MEGFRTAVWATSLFLLFYTLSPYIGLGEHWIVLLFLLSPFLMIWMVLSILIKGKPSSKKFDDGHLYEDYQAEV